MDSVRIRALRGDVSGLLRLTLPDSLWIAHIWPTTEAYRQALDENHRRSSLDMVRTFLRMGHEKGARRLAGSAVVLGDQALGSPADALEQSVAVRMGSLDVYLLNPQGEFSWGKTWARYGPCMFLVDLTDAGNSEVQ